MRVVIDCCSAEIVACYGSDMTEHALNHRFRYIRAQCEIIWQGREAKLDMKDLPRDDNALPKTVGAIDKKSTQSILSYRYRSDELSTHFTPYFHITALTICFIDIAKYFGQSTPDGIQFQFRTIKKDADKMRDTADSGGDPSTCIDLNGGGGPSSSFTPTTTPKTQRSRNFTTPTTGGGSTAKRSRTAIVKIESDDEDGDDSESGHNWSEMEAATPSKRPRMTPTPGQKNGGPPSRLAAARASATIADASAQLQTSESELDMPSSYTGRSGTAAPQRGPSRGGTANGNGFHHPSSLFPSAPAAAPAQQQQNHSTVQRNTASLFGSVGGGGVAGHPFTQSPVGQLSPPSSSMLGSSDAFRKTGTDAFFGGASGGGSFEFTPDVSNQAHYDDDDVIDGEI